MNEFDPFSGDHLEISREELENLFSAIAAKLVLKGVVNPSEDAIVYEGEKTPFAFTYELPASVVKQIFYHDDPEMITTEAQVRYDQEHRIDDPPEDQLIRDVYVFMRSRLKGREVFVDQVIRLSQDNRPDSHLTGDVDVQYSDVEGFSLSYPAVEQIGTQDEIFKTAIERYVEGVRPLMLNDIEKLRQLIDYLDFAPAHNQ